MNHCRVRDVSLIVGQLTVLCLLSGCGTGSGGIAKYTPSPTTAREALDTAMAAWKRGEPTGKISGATTAVEVADSTRQAGRLLASYEIIGEIPGDGPKRFSVRLRLENPSQELEARYVVVGLDPIWVFSEQDYEQSKGM